MLKTEIRNIDAREPPLNKSMERQRQETEAMRKKLEAADEHSRVLRAKVQELTDTRVGMRKQLARRDQENWAARIQGLVEASATPL
jgi:predicted  nucleic acid-binding Zn-ribbon protein